MIYDDIVAILKTTLSIQTLYVLYVSNLQADEAHALEILQFLLQLPARHFFYNLHASLCRATTK